MGVVADRSPGRAGDASRASRHQSVPLERAVPRVRSIDPARRPGRNELNRDGARLDGAFVPEVVHVVAAGIDEPHPLGVDAGLAVVVVPLVRRHRPPR